MPSELFQTEWIKPSDSIGSFMLAESIMTSELFTVTQTKWLNWFIHAKLTNYAK